MCGEQGFIAVHQTVHLVVNKFIGKGCSIFFANAYVTLLSTTGYKILKKYSSRIHLLYLHGRTTAEQTYTISGLC